MALPRATELSLITWLCQECVCAMGPHATELLISPGTSPWFITPLPRKISPSLCGSAPGHALTLPGEEPAGHQGCLGGSESHLCPQGSSAIISHGLGSLPAASASSVPAWCRPGTSRALCPASWGEGPLVTLFGDLFDPSPGVASVQRCVLGAAALLWLSRTLCSSSLMARSLPWMWSSST